MPLILALNPRRSYGPKKPASDAISRGILQYWKHHFKERGLTPAQVDRAVTLHREGYPVERAVQKAKAGENPWAIQITETAKRKREARQMLLGLKRQQGFKGGRIYRKGSGAQRRWAVQGFMEDAPEAKWLPEGMRRVIIPFKSMAKRLGYHWKNPHEVTKFKLILTTPEGQTLAAENVLPESRADTLQRAKKFYFGKKGSMSYRDLVARHKDSTLSFTPQRPTGPTSNPRRSWRKHPAYATGRIIKDRATGREYIGTEDAMWGIRQKAWGALGGKAPTPIPAGHVYFGSSGYKTLRAKNPPRLGQTESYHAHGKTFDVKLVSRGNYFIQIRGEPRARWASYWDQVKEDLEYFKASGALPRSKGQSWYNPPSLTEKYLGVARRARRYARGIEQKRGARSLYSWAHAKQYRETERQAKAHAKRRKAMGYNFRSRYTHYRKNPWKRKTRTLAEARKFLSERYDAEALKYPSLRKISKTLYIKRNERAARKYFAPTNPARRAARRYRLMSKRYVDRRSIRTIRLGRSGKLMRVGCPKGYWKGKRCRLGMRGVSVLVPKRRNPWRVYARPSPGMKTTYYFPREAKARAFRRKLKRGGVSYLRPHTAKYKWHIKKTARNPELLTVLANPRRRSRKGSTGQKRAYRRARLKVLRRSKALGWRHKGRYGRFGYRSTSDWLKEYERIKSRKNRRNPRRSTSWMKLVKRFGVKQAAQRYKFVKGRKVHGYNRRRSRRNPFVSWKQTRGKHKGYPKYQYSKVFSIHPDVAKKERALILAGIDRGQRFRLEHVTGAETYARR